MATDRPHSPSAPADVAILGAGVIGLAIGWRAAQAGLRVVIVDRGAPGAATSAVAAGMLAPVSEADAAEPELLALMRQAAAGYPAFIAELEAAAGTGAGLLQSGSLAVARDRDEAEALARELELRRAMGLDAELQRLLPSTARELEPALAPVIRAALSIPGEHAVDPRRLTAALARAAELAGAEIREGAAVRAVVQGGLLLAGGSRVHAHDVVVAAGPWSARIEGLPPVPVHPVKGQTLRLRDPAGPGLVSRVIRMGSGYLVPRGDGAYVLGATAEERGFDRSPTAGGIFELLRDAIELIPGLSELAIEELAVGLRPGTPDNRPIIGRGSQAGLFWATGHYRHGILLAPLTAELVVSGLRGAPGRPELSPARFAAGAPVLSGARA